jgi:hypothetical protein
MTIDEIELDRDGEYVATLVDDEGRSATIPLALLPDNAKVNQVITAGFELDDPSTDARRERIHRLQHRLFSRRGDTE